MDQPWVELTDFNGDALPDILRTDPYGGPHVVYFNRGESGQHGDRVIHWGSGVEVGGDARAWDVNLAEAHGAIAHLADMDADGVADLVVVAGGDAYAFSAIASAGAPSWAARRRLELADSGSPPPAPFGGADVRTADLDFDKRIDIIQSVSVSNVAAYRFWLNLDGRRYARPVTVPHDAGFRLSEPGVHLADMNGDRVPDIVRVRPSGLQALAGLGYGRFASLVDMAIPDYTLEPDHVGKARLEDLTGDGLADLVIIGAASGELWLWENLGNYTLGARRVVTGLPAVFGTERAIRWADINGNGTTDLVCADHDAFPRLQAVDIGRLFGCVPAPNVLVAVDNGIGRHIALTYDTSTRFALADAEAGAPWSDALPFPVHVVAGVTVADSLGNRIERRISYHEGYYDPAERQFRGFARIRELALGDASVPALVTQSRFHTGKGEETMKGKLLYAAAERENGDAFWQETTEWGIRQLYPGLHTRHVRFAHPVSRVRNILECDGGEPRRIETEFEYDRYGNVIATHEYGIVEGDDRSAFGDERITRTEYAVNLADWLVRFPMRTTVEDLAGQVISREETFYDDPTFGGANPGTVAAGKPTLVRRWSDPANPSAVVEAARTVYDAYGSPNAFLDPLAYAPGGTVDCTSGHCRTIAYDEAFHAFPVSETIHVGAGKDDLVIAAEYDPGWGVTVSSTEPNGHRTVYTHDAVGRLTAISRSGDLPGYPSVEYEYALAQPSPMPAGVLRGAVAAGVINWIEARLLDCKPGVFSAKRDHYLISRRYVDGLGRDVMRKQEAERAPAGGSPRVFVTGAVRFNARGTPAAELNPFYVAGGTESLDDLLSFENISLPGWQGVFEFHGELVALGLVAAHQTRLEYDALGRPVRSFKPDGAVSEKQYSPLVVTSLDEEDTRPGSPHNDTPTVHVYDGRGRLVQVDQVVRLNEDGTPAGAAHIWTTAYEYRPDGLLTEIVDAQNNHRHFDYDGLGRRTLTDDPDRGRMLYTYDHAGNLVRSVDSNAQQTAYTYDGANRLLTKDYLDAAGITPDVSFTYDTPSPEFPDLPNTRGRAAWLTDRSGMQFFAYDRRGNTVLSIRRIHEGGREREYRCRRTYDAMDRVTATVCPDGERLVYLYNERGLLDAVPGFVQSIDYDVAGNTTAFVYANGVSTTYAYDNRLRLAALETVNPMQRTDAIQSLAYTLDGTGNIVAISDRRPVPTNSPGNATQAFEYDNLYRITRAQGPGYGAIDYRYDRIGNMLRKASPAAPDPDHINDPLVNLGVMTSGGSAGTAGRGPRLPGDPPGPHAITATQNGLAYDYDDNGNMTRHAAGDLYTWDFEDRLTRVQTATTDTRCVYDYAGQRVLKVVTGGAQERISIYVNDEFEIREDKVVKYVFADGRRVARVETPAGASGASQQTFQFYPGWNFFALTVEPDNPNVEALLADIAADVTHLCAYDARRQAYLVYVPGEPAADLLEMHALTGYAARVTVPVTFTVTGTPVNGGITLFPGWNLAPFPVDAPMPAAEALASIADTCTTVWRFDAAGGEWQTHLPPPNTALSTVSTVYPAEACWFRMKAAGTLERPPPTDTIHFFHPDHMGSSNVVTDANGVVVERTEFYPYGLPRYEEPSPFQSTYRFADKELDRESGLMYFEARYYEPAIGRFVSVDPLALSRPMTNLEAPVLGHRYAYAALRPLTLADSTGCRIEVVWRSDWTADKQAAWAALTHEERNDYAAAGFAPPNPVAEQARALEQWQQIEGYLRQSQTADTVLGALKARQETVTIMFQRGVEPTAGHDFIWIDPMQGTQVAQPDVRLARSEAGKLGEPTGFGSVISPALGLFHELAHKLQSYRMPEQYQRDQQQRIEGYGNLEEKRVIELERQVARELRAKGAYESSRYSHAGLGVSVGGPTSTVMNQ
jgi:RHS repeat-associated protein